MTKIDKIIGTSDSWSILGVPRMNKFSLYKCNSL
jgi:hypothetical protein